MTVEPEPQDLEVFRKEFEVEYLNSKIKVDDYYNKWSEKDPKYFAKIAKPLKGMRCLRQDPWECTLSFICSQNNNIKRINQLVKSLRDNFGEPIIENPNQSQNPFILNQQKIYSFPTLE